MLKFSSEEIANAVAHVVAKQGIKNPAAQAGVEWLAQKNWGAAIQGEGFTTYTVPPDWDGHRFSGYFKPTLIEVCDDTSPAWWSGFELRAA